jgi:hypothetical protein
MAPVAFGPKPYVQLLLPLRPSGKTAGSVIQAGSSNGDAPPAGVRSTHDASTGFSALLVAGVGSTGVSVALHDIARRNKATGPSRHDAGLQGVLMKGASNH